MSITIQRWTLWWLLVFAFIGSIDGVERHIADKDYVLFIFDASISIITFIWFWINGFAIAKAFFAREH